MSLLSDIIDVEPIGYEEAIKKQVWLDAMVEEYNSIMKNEVWDVMPRPKNNFMVSSKWIYKIKHALDGSIEKYKARFVAHAFSQKEGVDYEETFAPVALYTSIRSIMAVAAKMGWKLHQMDVKTTFLNGVVEEEVYLEQPQGFETHDKETRVQIKEALYGLKQAPRTWYDRIDGFLKSMGFTKSKADSDLYYKVVEDEGHVILLLYIDDLFLIGEEKLIVECKKKLAAKFEMKDLGQMHYILGLEVWQNPKDIFLNQGKYAVEILKRFGMMDSHDHPNDDKPEVAQ